MCNEFHMTGHIMDIIDWQKAFRLLVTDAPVPTAIRNVRQDRKASALTQLLTCVCPGLGPT
jgi:hypothetical protein